MTSDNSARDASDFHHLIASNTSLTYLQTLPIDSVAKWTVFLLMPVRSRTVISAEHLSSALPVSTIAGGLLYSIATIALCIYCFIFRSNLLELAYLYLHGIIQLHKATVYGVGWSRDYSRENTCANCAIS